MRSTRARIAALAATSLLTTIGVGLSSTGSVNAAVNDQGVSGTASSIWQTNNNVEALAVAGGVLYAGGRFTSVRPPGAAAGTSETARTYLAAFNASTGALITTFKTTLNGYVATIALSPDKTKLYIGGAFTTVNGTARNYLAEVNASTGALVTGFTANANHTVTALATTGNTLYAGGDFTTIKSVSKSRFASLNATTGAVNAGFTASLDGRAIKILVAPDGSRVLVGGQFTTVNGGPPSGMASVDPTTGALEPWAVNSVVPVNGPCAGRVTDIVAQGNTAYVTAEGDPPGCYEGTYAANISDGALVWNSTCLGASQGLAILNNVLYKASHQHDCAFNAGDAHGGFVGSTSRDGFIWQRLIGMNIADGTFVHWAPNTNAATGSDPVGPHKIATDGSQLFVGGDFTYVNNVAQQGLTRFQSKGNNSAPNNPAAPTVQPTKGGTLTVTWPAVYDRDSGTLTYSVFRDGSTTARYSVTGESYPWSRPTFRYDDTGLAAGSAHTYRIQVSDGTLLSAKSASSVSRTVATAAPAAYPTVVGAAAPATYWRLGDAGTTAADSSASGANTGTFVGGVTTGQPGALGGDSAVRLDGSSGYVTSANPLTLGASFTESAWFKTTSIHGGSLLAMSDQPTGAGGSTDRAITMDNNGNLVFSTKATALGHGQFGPRLTSLRVQGPIYNDGRWHQVVATYDGTTMSLYVDGTLSGSTPATAVGMTSGYQRVGYADLSQIQAVFGINFYHQTWPSSEHFDGSVDEVANYTTALTATQVAAQFASAVAGGA